MPKKKVKVMVFGVFDGVHEGHRALLKQAKALGDYLIVAIAQDHIVQHLKGHLPEIRFEDRVAHLMKEDGVDKVIAGDEELGTWAVVAKEKPDVVAVGYDQTLLRANLERHLKDMKKPPEIKVLDAYEPNIYHTSQMK